MFGTLQKGVADGGQMCLFIGSDSDWSESVKCDTWARKPVRLKAEGFYWHLLAWNVTMQEHRHRELGFLSSVDRTVGVSNFCWLSRLCDVLWSVVVSACAVSVVVFCHVRECFIWFEGKEFLKADILRFDCIIIWLWRGETAAGERINICSLIGLTPVGFQFQNVLRVGGYKCVCLTNLSLPLCETLPLCYVT